MILPVGDQSQPAMAAHAEPAPIFKVVPTPVPTPLPAPASLDKVELSESAEARLLRSQGEDQTQIDARLDISVISPGAEIDT